FRRHACADVVVANDLAPALRQGSVNLFERPEFRSEAASKLRRAGTGCGRNQAFTGKHRVFGRRSNKCWRSPVLTYLVGKLVVREFAAHGVVTNKQTRARPCCRPISFAQVGTSADICAPISKQEERQARS